MFKSTVFTFALSAWDVRVVANFNYMFGAYQDASLSFCGFYWMTSGTAILHFTDADGSTLIPDINIDATGEICHCPAVSEGVRGVRKSMACNFRFFLMCAPTRDMCVQI